MPKPDSRLTAIGLDADDTLWHAERFFRETEEALAGLLADFCPPAELHVRLMATERRNLELYGYGIKGFTLSMIETAHDICGGRISSETVRRIVDLGREMIDHPIELLPHAMSTVENLSGRFPLVLITKGDLLHQERKLSRSGLGEMFHRVEIVSEKTVETFSRVFGEHGAGPERSLMIGNSVKSDILPALAAGAWAAHVPHDLNWELEAEPPPTGHPKFRELGDLGEAAQFVEHIQAS